MYKPYVIFGWISSLLAVLGLAPFVPVRPAAGTDEGGGHLQSLILGAVLLILSFLSVMLGIISDLIRTNRILIEANLEHTKGRRFATTAIDDDEDDGPLDARRRLLIRRGLSLLR